MKVIYVSWESAKASGVNYTISIDDNDMRILFLFADLYVQAEFIQTATVHNHFFPELRFKAPSAKEEAQIMQWLQKNNLRYAFVGDNGRVYYRGPEELIEL